MRNQIDLGARLKSIRKHKNWSQAQFAEKLNLSVDAVSNLERNLNRPSFATLEKLCEVSEISLRDLFDFGQVDDPTSGKITSLVTLIHQLDEADLSLVLDFTQRLARKN